MISCGQFHCTLWQSIRRASGIYVFGSRPVQQPICFCDYSSFPSVVASADISYQRIACGEQHTVPHPEFLCVLERWKHFDWCYFLRGNSALLGFKLSALFCWSASLVWWRVMYKHCNRPLNAIHELVLKIDGRRLDHK